MVLDAGAHEHVAGISGETLQETKVATKATRTRIQTLRTGQSFHAPQWAMGTKFQVVQSGTRKRHLGKFSVGGWGS